MKRIKQIVVGTAAVILAVGTALFFILGYHRRPRTIRHFEEKEYSRDRPFILPSSTVDGLAVYAVGDGEPVLLFPYPHAQTTTPMAQGALAEHLVSLGRTVITFDVPGTYRSTREPVGDMDEMIRSAVETLDWFVIQGPVDVVGHSMGGLSALAFAVERPERTNRLVLIGAMSGFPAVFKWGMPRSSWHVLEADFWRFMVWGLRVKNGRGSLADHKQLQNLMGRVSFHDQSLFVPLEIDPDDHEQGIPIREFIWGKSLFRRLSYAERLATVRTPALIIAGLYDPEAPLPCSEELARGLPDARLLRFEHSGHFPHIEESARFSSELQFFLNGRNSLD